VAALVRSPVSRQLRVLGTVRDTELEAPGALAVLLADLATEGILAQRHLAPLNVTEARQLLGTLWREDTSPDDDLIGRIVQRTGGIPFFLVNCAASVQLGASDVSDAVSSEKVPWDVEQSIAARIALLPLPARSLMGAMAVAGGPISASLLVRVIGLPEEETLEALEIGCRAGLLVESEGAYQLAHDLIREVVESTLSTARRMMWHRHLAQALEAGAAKPVVEALAFHYTRSGARDRAVVYLQRAAERSTAMQAHAEAARYDVELIRQLEALGRTAELAAAHEHLGMALMAGAQYDAAIASYDQAALLYQTTGDTDAWIHACAEGGRACARNGAWSLGLARLQPCLEGNPPYHDVSLTAQASLQDALTETYFAGNQITAALLAAEQTGTLAQAAGDMRLQARALHWRGCNLLSVAPVSECFQLLEEALSASESVGDRWTVSLVLYDMALIAQARGDFVAARRYVARALDAAAEVGDPMLEMDALWARGNIAFTQGDWSQARRDFDDAAALSDQVHMAHFPILPQWGLHFLALAEGRWEEAARCQKQAVSLAERSGNERIGQLVSSIAADRDLLEQQFDAAGKRLAWMVELADRDDVSLFDLQYLPLLAWTAYEQGSSDKAERWAARAVALSTVQETTMPLIEAQRILALIHQREHRWEEAGRLLEIALAHCRALSYPYAEAKVLYVYGQLLAAQDAHELARARYEQALAICARLGERLYAAHIECALGSLRLGE
jgi:tetratricopeptide (TPR) repeat protein